MLQQTTTLLSVSQTLELGLMLAWAVVAVVAGLLLALPNSVHPTRRCTTQIAYVLMTYAGVAGMFGFTAVAFAVLLAGSVVYYKQYKAVKVERRCSEVRQHITM